MLDSSPIGMVEGGDLRLLSVGERDAVTELDARSWRVNVNGGELNSVSSQWLVWRIRQGLEKRLPRHYI